MLAPPLFRRAPRRFLLLLSLATVPAAIWLAIGPGDDRVLTTAGMRPRALVHPVGDGEALREIDGLVRRVDLATDEPIDSPPPAALLSEAADLESGWITFAYWNNASGRKVTTFSSTWEVPAAPATRSRQTIFLFNGMMNRGANYGILQPVLQWGRSYAGGGDYWSVASWYVTSRGQAFHTPLVRVEPGDVLVGEMALVAEERGKFSYRCELRGMPRTRLLLKNVAELTWSTESLEAYNVTRCSDYPAARGVPFTAIHLRRSDGPPEMRWIAVDRVTDCDQHTDVVSHSPTGGRVDLQMRR